MSIREIRSIFELVSFKATPLKNFFQYNEPGTKLHTFLKGIEASKWESDSDAAAELYGGTPSEKRYMMLRNKLSEEMALSLPFYDYSKRFSALASKTLEFQRSLIAITIMLHAGITTPAMRMTKKLLKEAAEYDVTQVRLQCLRMLREDALYSGDIEAMKEYEKEFAEMLELYNLELQAEALCQEVEAYFINSTEQKTEIAEKAFEYEKRISSKSGINSSTLELYRFRLLLYALQLSGRISEARDTCIRTKEYLRSKPLLNSRTRQAEFSLCAMDCSIMLRRYQDALGYGLECLSYYTRGRRNWFLVVNSSFLCALHLGEYDLAVDLYSQTVQDAGFEKLPQFDQQKWALYQAYLSLFFSIGFIHTEDVKVKKMFRVGESQRVILEAFKDKKGLNIPLHVLHILSYLHIGDFQQVSSRIDAFQKYAQSHLQDDEHRRTFLFLAMLKILRKKRYNVAEATGPTEKYYQELLALPLRHEQFVEANEIMPYDKIWLWICENTTAEVAC